MTPGSQSRRSQIESYSSQLGWNTYFLFNSYSELCVENQWRGGRKHCFVNICSLAMLYSLVGDRSWGGAESFIQGQLKLHLFRGRILAEATCMTHFGMFYRQDISMFYFYEPLLFQIFQIFIPWKFIKTSAFPCLLSLLPSRATQITISTIY